MGSTTSAIFIEGASNCSLDANITVSLAITSSSSSTSISEGAGDDNVGSFDILFSSCCSGLSLLTSTSSSKSS